MADKKISALTGATTPLAGTEVLPIVQSGSTVKVSVDNLTAGRDISASGATFTKSGVTQVTIANTTGTTKNTQLIYADNVGSKWRLGMDVATNNNTNNFQLYSDVGGAAYFTINSGGDFTLNVGNLVQGTAAKGVNFTANTGAAGMTSQLLNWYEEGTWTATDQSGAGLTLTTSKGLYTRIGRLVTINAFIIYPSTASGANAIIGGLPFTNASGNYVSMSIIPSNNASVAAYVDTASTNIKIVDPTNYGTAKTNANLSTAGLLISISYMV